MSDAFDDDAFVIIRLAIREQGKGFNLALTALQERARTVYLAARFAAALPELSLPERERLNARVIQLQLMAASFSMAARWLHHSEAPEWTTSVPAAHEGGVDFGAIGAISDDVAVDLLAARAEMKRL